jgi:LysM repeat protein
VAEHPAIDAAIPAHELSDAKTGRSSIKRSASSSVPPRQSADGIIPAIHIMQDEGDQSKSFRITVQPGESLWSLAKKYKTRVETLRAINGLTGDQVIVGQELRLP